jgi:hypothetical protein
MDGRGAAVNFSSRGSHAHFAQQVRGRQVEEGLGARILQSGEAEAASGEGALEAAGERSAHAAVAVEENPAANGAASFRISYF